MKQIVVASICGSILGILISYLTGDKNLGTAVACITSCVFASQK